MGIYKAEIANMRKNLGNNIGQKIIIKEPLGRRGKPEEKEATIEKTYQNYFMVRYDSFNRVGSYNYTDLFMKTVEVSVYDGNDYVPLDVPDVVDKKNKLHKLVLPKDTDNLVNPGLDITVGAM